MELNPSSEHPTVSEGDLQERWIDLFILQPTPFCNLDCDYCYLPDRGNRARISEARVIREALASYLAKEDRVRLEPVGRSVDGGIAAEDEEALEDLGFGRK